MGGSDSSSHETSSHEAVSTPRTLWRNRDFMTMWTGQSVSLIGSEVTMLALPMIAISVLDASTFSVALLTTFSTLPWLLISLPAGVVVDRARRLPVMFWCNIGRAAVLLSIPIAMSTDIASIGLLFAVAGLSGCLNVFFGSAFLAYPASLLQKEQLVSASGMLLTATSIAGLVGPGMAGLIIGWVGPGKAVWLDILTYLLSAASLLLIKYREPRPARRKKPKRAFLHEMVAGLKLIVADRVLTAITVSNSVGNFLMAAVNAIMILYMVRELGWSVEVVGLVVGAKSVGGILGSLLAAPLIKRFGMTRALLYSQIMFAPGQILLGLVSPGIAGQIIAAVGMTVTMISALIYNIAQRSYRITTCPPEALGRLNATVSWLQWGLRPLAGVAGGFLGTALDLRVAILCLSSLFPAGVMILWFSPLRKYRLNDAAHMTSTH